MLSEAVGWLAADSLQAADEAVSAFPFLECIAGYGSVAVSAAKRDCTAHEPSYRSTGFMEADVKRAQSRHL